MKRLEGLRKELDTIVPRVQQVMRQAKQRIFGGDTHVAEKLVSIFEPTTESHEKKLGCTPRLMAGDDAFYSAKNETAAHERGVKRVCIPNRSTKSADRKVSPPGSRRL